MNYEIFSYGNVDALSGLFNALAALMGGSVFLSAISIVFVVGFFGAFFASAMAPDRLIGPKWLMSVILIYVVLFVPKATVQVVDKVGGMPPSVIANVPLGLAFQAGIVSSVGSNLTDLFEQALQVLPGTGALSTELTFSNHGLMFGARLVERSRAVTFADPVVRADVVNFLQNCTFFDISQGYIPANVFASSTNLWPLIADTNPARFSAVTDPGTGIANAQPCPTAYAMITPRLAPAVQQIATKLGLEMNPALQLLAGSGSLPGAQAAALLANQLPAAYVRARIGDASTDAATILLQSAMINSVEDANLLMSQRVNDGSATLMGLARGQATKQLNAQQLMSARMMSEAMPLIRNGIEAVLYGIFPFILLLSMLTGGMQAFQMLKMYGLALIWIALWPPIYAIINYLGTLAWAKNTAAAAYLTQTGATGLALASAGPISATTISDMAVIGNLVLSVPAIAGAVAFGLNKITNVAMGFSTATTSAAATGAGAVATGNVSAGNASFEQQQLSPNRSSAHMSTFSNLRGSTAIEGSDMRYQQNIGSNVFRMGSSSELSARFGEASTKSHAFATEQARAAEKATNVALDRVLSNVAATSTGTQGGAGYAGRHGAGTESTAQKTLAIRDQLARDLGISDTSLATSALALSLRVGNSKSETASGKDDAGVVQAIGKMVNVGIGTTGTQTTNNQVQAAVKRARQAASDAGITDAGKIVDDYAKSEDFRQLAGSNREEANRVAATIKESQGLRSSASASFRQSEEYRQSAENVRAAALRGEIDWTPEFNRYLSQNGALGATGDEAVSWANKFFHEAGIGVGADGQPKAVLYEGMGPGNVTVTPGSYRDPNVLRQQQQSAALEVDGAPVTAGSLAAKNAGNRTAVGAIGTGSAPGVPTSEADLRGQYEAQRAEQEKKIAKQRGAGSAAQGQLDGQFDEAAKNTSWTHHFGDQPDGRSGNQQVQQDQKERGR